MLDQIVLAAAMAVALIVVGILVGRKTQRARVVEALSRETEARRLAEQKISDSVNGRTLAFAIRALDRKPAQRPDGIGPNTILVEMADRFFPLPSERDPERPSQG